MKHHMEFKEWWLFQLLIHRLELLQYDENTPFDEIPTVVISSASIPNEKHYNTKNNNELEQNGKHTHNNSWLE